MKKVVYSINSDCIEIVPISDVHIGSPQFDESLFKEVCEYIEEHDNCYTILNGDLVDNATRSSIGSIFEETLSPASQVALACKYLEPLAKKKKIINMVSGNHEMRSDKDVGLSPSDLILAGLMKWDETLNQRYSLDSCFTFLQLEERPGKSCTFTIMNMHGSGGGSKIGAKIQKLDDMSMIAPANVYIRSHTHQAETHRGVIVNVNTNTKSVKEEDCLYVNTGSYLRGLDGYGNRMGMKPTARSIPVITLKVKRAYKTEGKKEHDYFVKKMSCVLKESVYD